jgi:succinyl-diaminopimelate desuccinylase
MTKSLDLSLDGGALTAALVDIESVSENEQRIADLVEAALRPLAHLETTRDGNAVVARTLLGHSERVVIAGHLDTVPIADNVPSRRDGDRLYGCGTTDMKAGVAVQLRLAAHVPDPNRDVTYVFYDCEEIDAARNGLGRLARTVPELIAGDFAVLMEPTNARVEGGCQGMLHTHVIVRGERAHSARGWLGRNAIHQAAPILKRLSDYRAERVMVDGLEYREGLNATLIRGGHAANVIPDECVVNVNYRFAPSRTVEEAYDCVVALFPEFEVTLVDSAPGARPGLDQPAAAAFVRAVGGEVLPKFGWTDVARFSALGVPAVNFGPGDPNVAHTRGEYVELERIVACEHSMIAWLTA